MRGLIVVPLLVLLAGCSQPRYFTPRENLNGRGPDGDAAAVYKVRTVPSESAAKVKVAFEADPKLGPAIGEVRIWSGGAKSRTTAADERIVELHVGFELENTGDAPLHFDLESVAVEELLVDGQMQDQISPVEVTGTGVAAPGSTGRVDLLFCPQNVCPQGVESFSVRFVMRDGAGNSVAQVTPFEPVRIWRQRDPGWGYRYGGRWGGYYGIYGGYGLWGGPSLSRRRICR